MMNDGQNDFMILQQQIDEAERENKPYNHLVKAQIRLLEVAHDQFIELAKKEGYDVMHDYKVGDIEIQQYAAMKQLSAKIGLPVEQYDEKIKQIRIRIFGEENYKRFFGEQTSDLC